jgi:hypothetical protein
MPHSVAAPAIPDDQEFAFYLNRHGGPLSSRTGLSRKSFTGNSFWLGIYRGSVGTPLIEVNCRGRKKKFVIGLQAARAAS